MVDIRPATHDDVMRVAKEPLPKTGRTLAIEAKGDLVAITGYYFAQGNVVIYCMVDQIAKEKSDFYALDIVRCGQMIIEEAKKLGMPILAAADRNIPGSDKLLLYLGFQPTLGGIYKWPCG